MSLPGKLCVGILEEDNPLRSYFRFKPLLVEENGRYRPFQDAELYPDEGCIRIVPDKNESYYFKSRMRQNGLFSVVDLRDHPSENDKIRQNKNYRSGGEENNAYIIYSDVVHAPAAEMIYQLLPVEAAQSPLPRPHAAHVLLKQPDGINPPATSGWGRGRWARCGPRARAARLRTSRPSTCRASGGRPFPSSSSPPR